MSRNYKCQEGSTTASKDFEQLVNNAVKKRVAYEPELIKEPNPWLVGSLRFVKKSMFRLRRYRLIMLRCCIKRPWQQALSFMSTVKNTWRSL